MTLAMLNEGKDELVNHDQRILKRKLLQGEISEREIQNFCKNFQMFPIMSRKSVSKKTKNKDHVHRFSCAFRDEGV